MSIVSKIIAGIIPVIPRPLVGYFARPYIAGESLDHGIRAVRNLNEKGIMATMDVLGESVSTEAESLAMRNQCEQVLHAIHDNNLDSNLSIKPTQLGLSIDTDFCEENIRHLCRLSVDYGNFVRIDMEDHPYTDSTLRMYSNLRKEFENHVGTVIQSYLRRSEDDIRKLLTEGNTNLRLCKGIYVEPEEISFRAPDEIRNAFKLLNRTLLDSGAYVGIATHDDDLIEHSFALVEELDLDITRYEFQMLLGVRPRRRDSIVANGYRLRVYVPFGEKWYAYSTRRLKENPSMALHIVKAIFGFGK